MTLLYPNWCYVTGLQCSSKITSYHLLLNQQENNLAQFSKYYQMN